MRKYLAIALMLVMSAGFLSACGSTAVREVVVEEIPAAQDSNVSANDNQPAENESKTQEMPAQPEVKAEETKPANASDDSLIKKISNIDWFSAVTGANQSGDMFTLTWTDEKGNSKKLTDLGGKVYLIDVWAQWCPPCKASTPTLVELHDKYSKMGLVIIGVNIDDQGNIMQAMEFGVNEGIMGKYPILYDNQGAITGGVFVQGGIPNFTLLDKNGKLIKVHTGGLVKGYEGFDEFESIITSNLK